MTLLNLKESFNLFKKNLILILPDTISLLITYTLLAILFFYTGLSNLMPLVQSAENISLELFKNFFSENLTQIIISSIVFVFVTFIVGVGVTTIKFDMITDVLHNKKASFKASSFKCKSFFWPVVALRACIFVIFAVCLVITLLFGGLIYLVFNNWGSQYATVISLAFMIPLGLAIFILLKFSLLFVYQIMFLKNIKNSFKLLKESIKLFKKDTSFVFISGLLIFSLSLIFAGVANIISQLIGIIPVVSTYLSPIWSVIQMFISITISIICSVYLFLQLKTKKY